MFFYVDDKSYTDINSFPIIFKLGITGFSDVVKQIWSTEMDGNTPMDRWQAKIRKLCQYLRGGQSIQVGLIRRKRKVW